MAVSSSILRADIELSIHPVNAIHRVGQLLCRAPARHDVCGNIPFLKTAVVLKAAHVITLVTGFHLSAPNGFFLVNIKYHIARLVYTSQRILLFP